MSSRLDTGEMQRLARKLETASLLDTVKTVCGSLAAVLMAGSIDVTDTAGMEAARKVHGGLAARLAQLQAEYDAGTGSRVRQAEREKTRIQSAIDRLKEEIAFYEAERDDTTIPPSSARRIRLQNAIRMCKDKIIDHTNKIHEIDDSIADGQDAITSLATYLASTDYMRLGDMISPTNTAPRESYPTVHPLTLTSATGTITLAGLPAGSALVVPTATGTVPHPRAGQPAIIYDITVAGTDITITLRNPAVLREEDYPLTGINIGVFAHNPTTHVGKTLTIPVTVNKPEKTPAQINAIFTNPRNRADMEKMIRKEYEKARPEMIREHIIAQIRANPETQTNFDALAPQEQTILMDRLVKIAAQNGPAFTIGTEVIPGTNPTYPTDFLISGNIDISTLLTNLQNIYNGTDAAALAGLGINPRTMSEAEILQDIRQRLQPGTGSSQIGSMLLNPVLTGLGDPFNTHIINAVNLAHNQIIINNQPLPDTPRAWLNANRTRYINQLRGLVGPNIDTTARDRFVERLRTTHSATYTELVEVAKKTARDYGHDMNELSLIHDLYEKIHGNLVFDSVANTLRSETSEMIDPVTGTSHNLAVPAIPITLAGVEAGLDRIALGINANSQADFESQLSRALQDPATLGPIVEGHYGPTMSDAINRTAVDNAITKYANIVRDGLAGDNPYHPGSSVNAHIRDMLQDRTQCNYNVGGVPQTTGRIEINVGNTSLVVRDALVKLLTYSKHSGEGYKIGIKQQLGLFARRMNPVNLFNSNRRFLHRSNYEIIADQLIQDGIFTMDTTTIEFQELLEKYNIKRTDWDNMVRTMEMAMTRAQREAEIGDAFANHPAGRNTFTSITRTELTGTSSSARGEIAAAINTFIENSLHNPGSEETHKETLRNTINEVIRNNGRHQGGTLSANNTIQGLFGEANTFSSTIIFTAMKELFVRQLWQNIRAGADDARIVSLLTMFRKRFKDIDGVNTLSSDPRVKNDPLLFHALAGDPDAPGFVKKLRTHAQAQAVAKGMLDGDLAQLTADDIVIGRLDGIDRANHSSTADFAVSQSVSAWLANNPWKSMPLTMILSGLLGAVAGGIGILGIGLAIPMTMMFSMVLAIVKKLGIHDQELLKIRKEYKSLPKKEREAYIANITKTKGSKRYATGSQKEWRTAIGEIKNDIKDLADRLDTLVNRVGFETNQGARRQAMDELRSLLGQAVVLKAAQSQLLNGHQQRTTANVLGGMDEKAYYDFIGNMRRGADLYAKYLHRYGKADRVPPLSASYNPTNPLTVLPALYDEQQALYTRLIAQQQRSDEVGNRIRTRRGIMAGLMGGTIAALLGWATHGVTELINSPGPMPDMDGQPGGAGDIPGGTHPNAPGGTTPTPSIPNLPHGTAYNGATVYLDPAIYDTFITEFGYTAGQTKAQRFLDEALRAHTTNSTNYLWDIGHRAGLSQSEMNQIWASMGRAVDGSSNSRVQNLQTSILGKPDSFYETMFRTLRGTSHWHSQVLADAGVTDGASYKALVEAYTNGSVNGHSRQANLGGTPFSDAQYTAVTVLSHYNSGGINNFINVIADATNESVGSSVGGGVGGGAGGAGGGVPTGPYYNPHLLENHISRHLEGTDRKINPDFGYGMKLPTGAYQVLDPHVMRHLTQIYGLEQATDYSKKILEWLWQMRENGNTITMDQLRNGSPNSLQDTLGMNDKQFTDFLNKALSQQDMVGNKMMGSGFAHIGTLDRSNPNIDIDDMYSRLTTNGGMNKRMIELNIHSGTDMKGFIAGYLNGSIPKTEKAIAFYNMLGLDYLGQTNAGSAFNARHIMTDPLGAAAKQAGIDPLVVANGPYATFDPNKFVSTNDISVREGIETGGIVSSSSTQRQDFKKPLHRTDYDPMRQAS
ncbi:MAG: hypothetical protein NZL83_04665 [Candidatus Absconditabacterales bacterium]|nr:hypothetical protein [Candidatus Absconditabacterales bacterium]